jgi:uncharacterized integral membrane protein
MTQHPTTQLPEEAPNTWQRVKLGAGIAAIALLVLFLLQNLQSADINFLWFGWHTRMIWALLASAAFGGVGTILIGTFIRRHERRAGG